MSCTFGRRFVGGWLVLAGLLVTGCGDAPFSIVSVDGTVTYEDGTPIPAERMRLEFIPQAAAIDAATHPRPGMAQVDTSTGSFSSVTTHKYGDGLVVGQHKVLVLTMDEMENPTDEVSKEYRQAETTPLTVEVSGGSNTLELKVKKP